jgi:peptidoglycan/LPS O-acetylase OafA/YrhL
VNVLAPLKLSPAGRFTPLDGYRAFACLMVVVVHAAEGTGFVDAHPVMDPNFIGYFAVVILFTMSGFLVYKPFVDRHLSSRPAPSTGRFLWQRLLRIYPLYWVVVTVYFLSRDPGEIDVPGLWGWIRVYGLFQIYDLDTYGRGILVAWTLAVDVSFYLAVPLLALAARTAAKRFGTSMRARLSGELLVTLLFFSIGPFWRTYWITDGRTRLVDIWLPSQTEFFGLGMALAVTFSWVSHGGQLPRALRWLADHPVVCYVLAAELFWVLGQADLPRSSLNPLDAFRLGLSDQTIRYLVYTGAALLVFVPAVFGRATALSNRLLGSRPLRVMSELSYGVYLWHVFFLLRAVDWLGGKDVAGFLPTLYIGLVLALVASLVTYLTVERPTARLRNIGLPTLPKSPGPRARTTTTARPTA